MDRRTAGTLKWNTIDRVSTQVLYALVGIVLANILSQEDFGLVGALLVFQAFATLFVDSGFGSAILQKKDPTERDYSTIFWFNFGASVLVYVVLFFCAPLIADIFQHDIRLIPLSRVMFLAFIFNGLGMVQTVKLMKQQNVKMIAVANTLSLIVAGILGIWLAVAGYGPWALVWQSVSMAAVKSGWLWLTGHWWPRSPFSTVSLKSMWRLAVSVFSSSALNTFFLYIYSFVIGAFYNLTLLGVYTQADKWSKMGSASISQVLTASFIPVLAKHQEDPEAYRECMRGINGFTSLVVFILLPGMALVGAPIFHLLFANKWDEAIPLFQILALRGVFVVWIQLLSNYLLGMGYGRRLFSIEIVKDLLIAAALLATVWFGSLALLVWGQFAASAVTLAIALFIVRRAIGYRIRRFLADISPAFFAALFALALGALALWGIGILTESAAENLRRQLKGYLDEAGKAKAELGECKRELMKLQQRQQQKK